MTLDFLPDVQIETRRAVLPGTVIALKAIEDYYQHNNFKLLNQVVHLSLIDGLPVLIIPAILYFTRKTLLPITEAFKENLNRKFHPKDLFIVATPIKSDNPKEWAGMFIGGHNLNAWLWNGPHFDTVTASQDYKASFHGERLNPHDLPLLEWHDLIRQHLIGGQAPNEP